MSPNLTDLEHKSYDIENLGLVPGIQSLPQGAIEAANRLLQKNHDEHHMFWRDFAGHNHAAHNVLTRLALGADTSALELGFLSNVELGQRPPPPTDENVIAELATEEGFQKYLSDVKHYANYLVFFEREIDAKGFREVIQEYCFSRTKTAEAILARMFDGAFHPIIHWGLAVEFEQPSILAEALAQAATDASFDIHIFFANAEREAATNPTTHDRPLVELFHEARANETIRNSAHWEDMQFKMKNGVLKRAEKEIAALAAQFRVTPATLERRTAEMISCCAYFSGAAQRLGKARKIDFFYMHNVTSSIFLTVLARQDWIRVEDKVRLVEWKARLDLVWYATCGAPELHIEYIKNYQPTASAGWGWEELFRRANGDYDDGHVVKFLRALKNGEQVAKPFEEGVWADAFPVKGDMWLNLSRMAYDSTLGLHQDLKWIMFPGFDQPWGKIPDAEKPGF
ncbi:hypothetical protein M406DRAFT_346955 [Cryphonectria parasitica EP155]|uniref:Oxidoreductase AflY n=1 Tax=Cryphonectria parasitica (strain ATCC 38755 / EP155) TaxID=660469 RepID=A0A9P5CL66_CRYP1|nr:uncharacterized protein M406DRAFT_346955 [Cryphonectria parasitica EP155]KAF3763009.1 hypothetical protein M406DRAFT_346955 [Cryphonectria parasitica EP155]